MHGIVDRVLIERITDVWVDELTGVGVCLPAIMLVASFLAFTGPEAAPLASIALVRSEGRHASRILGNVVVLLGLFAVMLIAAPSLFGSFSLRFFGASSIMLPYASSQLSICLVGTFFMMAAENAMIAVLNGTLQASGDDFRVGALAILQSTAAFVRIR